MTGDQLKSNRKQKGWTQAQLGKRIGVTTGTIANYEKGRPIPDSKLEILDRVFQIGAEESDIFSHLRDLLQEDFLNRASQKDRPHSFLINELLSRFPPIYVINYIEQNRNLFLDSVEESRLLFSNTLRDEEIRMIKKEIADIKEKMKD